MALWDSKERQLISLETDKIKQEIDLIQTEKLQMLHEKIINFRGDLLQSLDEHANLIRELDESKKLLQSKIAAFRDSTTSNLLGLEIVLDKLQDKLSKHSDRIESLENKLELEQYNRDALLDKHLQKMQFNMQEMNNQLLKNIRDTFNSSVEYSDKQDKKLKKLLLISTLLLGALTWIL